MFRLMVRVSRRHAWQEWDTTRALSRSDALETFRKRRRAAHLDPLSSAFYRFRVVSRGLFG